MSRYQSNGGVKNRYDDDDNDGDSVSKIPDDESQNQIDASLGKDYVNVPSRPYIVKNLGKQEKMRVSQSETCGVLRTLVLAGTFGYFARNCVLASDKTVLFADKVLKFSGSGKIKSRILLLTEFAIYFFDPSTNALKRRIALAAVEKVCLSELGDNFLAIIIPTEYDVLIASTRKIEIVTALNEATKSASNYEIDVLHSNRFEYNAAVNLVKEVQFEEVEGGVNTRFVRKQVAI